ncbi:MAG TPA: alpha/beta hydrolase [Rubricoccaceae bacterium]|jgi:alpha-beta hydrolase superfamily lysophospholipase
MHHTTGTLAARDGTELFTRRWTPDFGTAGAVLVVHGVHEHSGRHAYLASALMEHGLDVFAYDARGHGHSGGTRANVARFSDFLDDLEVVLAHVRAEKAGRPLVLFGHSMGGLVAADYVAERGADGLAGLVLSSAALHTFPVPRLLERAAPYVAKWRPEQVVTPLDLRKLSHDPAVERAYREDPLNTVSGLKARLAHEILLASRRVQAHPEAFTLPLYLMHGTADRITPPGGSEWLAAHAPSPDVTLRLYDGLFHELMKEPERDAVIAGVADWIATHIEAAGASPTEAG